MDSTEKNKDSIKLEGILEQGYGLSPKKVMRDKNISIEAKAIYAYMSSFAGHGVSAFPSVSLMCDELGISELRLRKHRDALVEFGYIEIIREKGEKGKFGRNVYTIKQALAQPTIQNTMMVKTNHTKHHDGELPTWQNVGTNNNSSFNNNNNTNNNSNNIVDDKSPTPPATKKMKRVYQENEEPLVLAKYLYELMKRNNPYVREPNFQTWANDIRLLHESDKIDYMVIKNCITWCQQDSFWQSNILSPKKLRDKFPTLYAQAQRKVGNNYGRTKQRDGQVSDKEYDGLSL